MDKFSNVYENKIEKNVDSIRYQLLDIIDKTLRIESFGSARKEVLMTTKIINKEMLVDNIMKLYGELFNIQIKESLNNLKSYNNDWYSIDNYIDTIKEDNNLDYSVLIQFIETYKSFDDNLFKEILYSKFDKKYISECLNQIQFDILDIDINNKIMILKND